MVLDVVAVDVHKYSGSTYLCTILRYNTYSEIQRNIGINLMIDKFVL